MEPRRPRSIFQVVARQPGRYWRRRSPQVLRLLHSSYVCDGGKRAPLNDWLGHEVGPSSEFPQRPCGRGPAKTKSLHNGWFPIESCRSRRSPDATSGVDRTSVEASPEHHGDDSKPLPKLAAACKIADVRPTALRDGQNARRILGAISIVSSQLSTCGFMASR